MMARQSRNTVTGLGGPQRGTHNMGATQTAIERAPTKKTAAATGTSEVKLHHNQTTTNDADM